LPSAFDIWRLDFGNRFELRCGLGVLRSASSSPPLFMQAKWREEGGSQLMERSNSSIKLSVVELNVHVVMVSTFPQTERERELGNTFGCFKFDKLHYL
jgi:hypothetical protein